MVADEVDISSCSAKSCCQRWKSKHQPNLILEPFSDLEDAIIIAALQVSHGFTASTHQLSFSTLHSTLSACVASVTVHTLCIRP